jgi:hypothetical protein
MKRIGATGRQAGPATDCARTAQLLLDAFAQIFQKMEPVGDLLRALLYEAAQVMLTRVKKWPWLKTWAMNIARSSGAAKSRGRSCAPSCRNHAPRVERWIRVQMDKGLYREQSGNCRVMS